MGFWASSDPAANGDFSTENGHPHQPAGAFGIVVPADPAWDVLSS
jgi:hypothetical protein